MPVTTIAKPSPISESLTAIQDDEHAQCAAIARACYAAGRINDAGAFMLAGWTPEEVHSALANGEPPPPWEEEPETVAARTQRYFTFMIGLDPYGGPAPESRTSPDPAMARAWRLYDERKRQRACLARALKSTPAPRPTARKTGSGRRRRSATTRAGGKKTSGKKSRHRSSDGDDDPAADIGGAAVFAPRALLIRPPGIRVELTPLEFHTLIRALEKRACQAAEDPNQVDFADFLLRRVAALREAAR